MWVVVPAYHEASVIADVIADVRTVFPNVVCVDDGSRDDTAELANTGAGESTGTLGDALAALFAGTFLLYLARRRRGGYPEAG